MSIILGPNQYGKAENRVVRIYRDSSRHEVRDVNVSTSLRGDFNAAYTHNDLHGVLPTDTQKNTCYAYAKEKGIGEIEDYALALARHFVSDLPAVTSARVIVDEYAWERLGEHTFIRSGQEVRTAQVTVEDDRQWVVSGLKDLVVMKSGGAQFQGFLRDDYTTIQETPDRVMATSLVVRWRYASAHLDWGKAYTDIRSILLARFGEVQGLALQQTLWEMGKAVLQARPEVAEVMLSAPNRHHFAVDLSPFGLDNPNEVLRCEDRPYAVIECNVTRDDAPDAGPAWQTVPGLS
ncbi:factor-independent urate hydroxylase [Pseudonocardia spinosispora]|uniref:factor-independent urate hydroxylase n=1 Tax=Pseudonocardia spinosispora TaxID=103441 RepID=UPI00048EA9E3|nr:urate oxidase [Pseudonocardia spinosispora]